MINTSVTCSNYLPAINAVWDAFKCDQHLISEEVLNLVLTGLNRRVTILCILAHTGIHRNQIKRQVRLVLPMSDVSVPASDKEINKTTYFLHYVTLWQKEWQLTLLTNRLRQIKHWVIKLEGLHSQTIEMTLSSSDCNKGHMQLAHLNLINRINGPWCAVYNIILSDRLPLILLTEQRKMIILLCPI